MFDRIKCLYLHLQKAIFNQEAMRIKIEKQVEDTVKEVWSFNTFDFHVVFVGWTLLVRPKGKRKWTVEKYWDKYGRKYDMQPEPVLPEAIKSEAFTEAYKFIRVMTWDEYKK